MLQAILDVLHSIRIEDVLDIGIVSYILYKILGFIRETRAQQLVRGIIVLLAIFLISDIFKLYLLNWILKNVVTIGLFALIVLFQPELRRGLEHMGRKSIVSGKLTNIDRNEAIILIRDFLDAIEDFAKTKTGALIAIERQIMLTDIIETGVTIDGKISTRLLGNIFYEGAPLHDGAVIVRADKLYAASCVLPLTEKKLGRNLGTRHRAAVGLSEVSDALIIVVSEETGIISIAENGKLRRFIDIKTLEKRLFEIYMPENINIFGKATKLISKKGKGVTEDE